MAIELRIPTPLRKYTDNQEAVEVDGRTIRELLENLVSTYGSLRRHLYGDDGRLRSFVNVYVNDEDIRYLDGPDTPVEVDDVVTIVPSVAGGQLTESPPSDLSQEEIRRYSRHLIMPEVGMEGQQRLKEAQVLLIGAGGLGSPLGLYLAAAGVGTIGLVDFDRVEFSNLQRQILYETGDVGRSKLEATIERLHGINPEVTFVPHEGRLTSENALKLLEPYDVVVDGTDNFPTRYLVNDASVLLGKPNVYGSIFRFEGQISVFWAEQGPCYRCLYPEPPPPGLVPSCAEGGVLGVLPGIVGSLQAMETVKLILGRGRPLIGRLLLFDGLAGDFRQVILRKNPGCPVCGEDATITELIDYEEFCGVAEEEAPELEAGWEIEPEELKPRLDRGEAITILDVREPVEHEICRIEGSRLIPLGELPDRLSELDTAEDIVAHCHRGMRSAEAVQFLRQIGFRKIRNLKGGIDAWSEQVDPSVPRY